MHENIYAKRFRSNDRRLKAFEMDQNVERPTTRAISSQNLEAETIQILSPTRSSSLDLERNTETLPTKTYKGKNVQRKNLQKGLYLQDIRYQNLRREEEKNLCSIHDKQKAINAATIKLGNDLKNIDQAKNALTEMQIAYQINESNLKNEREELTKLENLTIKIQADIQNVVNTIDQEEEKDKRNTVEVENIRSSLIQKMPFKADKLRTMSAEQLIETFQLYEKF